MTEPPRAVTQHVTAVAGFAYGAIGADIHVFGDGTPLYLLEQRRTPPTPDRAWLRELPSRILDARSRVVAFTGRQSELDELGAWRDSEPRLAVRWLHAPGGQGKTRLADRFAAGTGDHGWQVVEAVPGVGAARPSPGSQDLRLTGYAGVLLIVEYADRWSGTALTWLFRNALLHQPGVPARVLLLARTAVGWPALRATLEHPELRSGTSLHGLASLPNGVDGARREMFAAARDGFAAVYGVADPTAVAPPVDLDRPEFGLALSLHVAALVAVDAHATGGRPPADADRLTRYLLDRERRHWAHLYEGRGGGLDYHTPPSLMARTVFTAALTGALPHADATALLSEVERELPVERILIDHARCYPPTGAGAGAGTGTGPVRTEPGSLNPLAPDRLAEDFLALALPGPGGPDQAEAWAPTRLDQLLGPAPAPARRRWPRRAPAHRPASPWLARAVTFLAAAAARWPHVGPGHLYPLLLAQPQLALAAGPAAVTTLAEIPDVDVDVLTAIEAQLPSGRHADLDVAAAAVSTALTRYRVAATRDPVELARLHTANAVRLANAGRNGEALAATDAAVAIRRRLAQTDTGHLPYLAASLRDRAMCLGRLGRDEEAVVQATEAVYVSQALADTHPGAYLPALADSLYVVGARLADQGRHRQAHPPLSNAVAIRRLLAAADPAAHLPDLATSLLSLGSVLAELGRREEGLALTEEAVAVRRRLVAVDPAAFRAALAAALVDLGNRLTQVGRHQESLGPMTEATDLYRRLVEANPADHLPALAGSLHNLCPPLDHLGRSVDALAPSAEAVDLYRRLAAAHPAAHLRHLAAACQGHSLLLQDLGQVADAIVWAEEAVDLYRRLAGVDPRAHLPGLAAAASNLGGFLAEAGRAAEALALAEESVAIRRRLADDDPDAHLPDLATGLTGYAFTCEALGVKLPEGLAAIEEAIDIWQPLAERLPGAFGGYLISAYLIFVDILDGLGQAEAAAELREQLDQLRRDAD